MRIKNISQGTIEISLNNEPPINIPPGKIGDISANAYDILKDSNYKDDFKLLDEIPLPPEEKTPIPEKIKKPERPQADINLVTTLWTSNGMGRVGEEVLLALDRIGLKINIKPVILEKDGLQKRTLELLEREYEPAPKTLFFSIPEHIKEHHTEENYVHIPWDTTRAPKEWVETLNEYATKIYPVSYFTEEVFKKSGIKVPMRVIKHGVNQERFSFLNRRWQGTFRFLTVGDLSIRKGTDVLIRAFQEAFPKEKDVELIVKSNKDLEWGGVSKPYDKRIKVITESYEHKDYIKLYQKAHCLVAPSRSEGFGLPVLEAMATGLPVVFHNWGGHSMMANDKYNFPITTEKEIPAPAWFYPESYSEGKGIGNWGEPDYQHLVKMMRFVYEQRDKAKKKGKLAAEWVKESWTWDAPVKDMWNDILGIATKTWGEFYRGDTLTKNNVQASANSHKELFWILRGLCADKIIEAGTGTGEMSGFLSWDKQELDGTDPNPHRPKKIIAMDIEEGVIKIAKANLKAIDATKRVRLAQADAFTFEEKADLIFAQGMLEHLTNEEMHRLVKHQLSCAPIVVHSVPNNDYGKLDFGNERLLSDEEYYEIFEGYDLVIYRYWKQEDKKIQSVLVFRNTEVPHPKTSIIMPILNGKQMTIDAIEAVRKHTKDYELIVLDNGSDDGIEKWLDKQKDIRVVHFPGNIGIPAAKNLGIAMSRGDYICFLDNDTVAGKGWLDTMLKVFDDPTIGFTAYEGWIIDKDRKFFMGKSFDRKEYIDWASHSIFVFPRKLIPLIGLLRDEDLWCVEDVDQCCKIRAEGYAGRLPDTKVNIKHLVSATAKYVKDADARAKKWHDITWEEWGDFILSRGLKPKIEIGVGFAPRQGYLHVDIQKLHHVEIVADARALPIKGGSVQEVFNSHLIEHFTRKEAKKMLSEWNRVLENDGVLRIVCPDFKEVCRKVAEEEISLKQGLDWMYGGQIDKYDFHYWGYAFENLKELLEEMNFYSVEEIKNPDWLEVVARKKTVKKKRICAYLSHYHTYGGGENLAFQIIRMLQDLYGEIDVISPDEWQIDPSVFGINLGAINFVKDGEYDTFINISHGNLHQSLGRNNIAMVYYPQFNWSNTIKQYQKVVTISDFCASEIKRKWQEESTVICPPTDVGNFRVDKKKKQILAVGRFFYVKDGNNKNHLEMIKAFKKLKGWKLIFVGSVQHEDYYEKVKKAAFGLNIEFKHGISFEELVELYAESKFLWHAAGYKTKLPSSFEHFGIVAVEALASGCQPLVFDAGGIAQIKGVEVWHDLDELVSKTKSLTPKPEKLVDFAKEYDFETIKEYWKKIIENA